MRIDQLSVRRGTAHTVPAYTSARRRAAATLALAFALASLAPAVFAASAGAASSAQDQYVETIPNGTGSGTPTSPNVVLNSKGGSGGSSGDKGTLTARSVDHAAQQQSQSGGDASGSGGTSSPYIANSPAGDGSSSGPITSVLTSTTGRVILGTGLVAALATLVSSMTGGLGPAALGPGVGAAAGGRRRRRDDGADFEDLE